MNMYKELQKCFHTNSSNQRNGQSKDSGGLCELWHALLEQQPLQLAWVQPLEVVVLQPLSGRESSQKEARAF
jgi:hypothetical protein